MANTSSENTELNVPSYPTLSARAYFSRKYFRAALLSAQVAERIEARYIPSAYPIVKDRHEASVITAIIASTASFEARIAELLTDVDDGHSIACQGLSSEKILLLKTREHINFDRRYPKTLGRCQAIYQWLSLDVPEYDSEIWRKTKELISLRNALIHIEPEDHLYLSPGEMPAEGSLEGRIGHLFKASVLAGEDAPFFPDRCLGAGCAVWAVQTVYQFLDQFGSDIGWDHGFPLPIPISRE